MEANISLADQFAGLRASPTTPNADTRILSAALHTLIAAIFARIFARLEQFLLLWQAGNLPATPARQIAPARQSRSPQVTSRRRRGVRRATRRRLHATVRSRASCAVASWANQLPALAALAAIILSSRPRSARAPPTVSVARPSLAVWRTHAYIITNTKRLKFFCFFLFTKRRISLPPPQFGSLTPTPRAVATMLFQVSTCNGTPFAIRSARARDSGSPGTSTSSTPCASREALT